MKSRKIAVVIIMLAIPVRYVAEVLGLTVEWSNVKKVVSLALAISMLAGTTVFAISEMDIAKFEKKQADANMKAVTEVKTKDGEDLTALIKHDKIIPIYYFANNGFEQFKDYETGEFYKEFQTEPVGYYVSTTDGRYIEIARYSEPDRSIGGIIDNYLYLFDSIIFNDTNLSKLLSDAGVNEITDMRVSYFMDYDSNVLFYINTDKGEFIVLSRNTHRVYFDDILEAGVLYTADEVVDWRKRVLVEAKAEDDYKQTLITNEPYWTVDKNGDDIYVTPKPKSTVKPTSEPKATQKPDTTTKPTVAPKSTDKPTATKKPINTAIPTPAASIDTSKPPTLSVKGGEHITVTVGEQSVDFPDAQPFIDENGRTQIPLRAFCESLGKHVSWFEDTQTICISSVPEGVAAGGKSVWFTIGENRYRVNGDYYDMDTVAVIKDERTYIPVRFAAEAMGLTVEWTK